MTRKIIIRTQFTYKAIKQLAIQQERNKVIEQKATITTFETKYKFLPPEGKSNKCLETIRHEVNERASYPTKYTRIGRSEHLFITNPTRNKSYLNDGECLIPSKSMASQCSSNERHNAKLYKVHYVELDGKKLSVESIGKCFMVKER